MDADAVFKKQILSIGCSNVKDLSDSEIAEMVLKFAIWLPAETHAKTPWLAPYAIRRQRIRIEPNAPGPKRDLWGLPTDQGYFADDNSLIKSFALKSTVVPENNPYENEKITKGLVCCHIWSGTTGKPLLFSFVPNLVWLPKSLAPFTDANFGKASHPAQIALKHASRIRFGVEHTLPRVESAWSLLDAPSGTQIHGGQFSELSDNGKISELVRDRVSRFTAFLNALLDPDLSVPQRFSKRYHAGVGDRIDRSVLTVQEWLSAEVMKQLITEMNDSIVPN